MFCPFKTCNCEFWRYRFSFEILQTIYKNVKQSSGKILEKRRVSRVYVALTRQILFDSFSSKERRIIGGPIRGYRGLIARSNINLGRTRNRHIRNGSRQRPRKKGSERKGSRQGPNDRHSGMADTVEPREDRGRTEGGPRGIKIEEKEPGTQCVGFKSRDQTNRSTSPRDASNFFPRSPSFFPSPSFFSFFFPFCFLSVSLVFFARPYVCPEPFLSRVLPLFAVKIYLSSPLFIPRRCLQVSGWGLTKNLGRESRFPTPLSLSNVALIPRWYISRQLSRDPLDPLLWQRRC